jgi:hypothetical protein
MDVVTAESKPSMKGNSNHHHHHQQQHNVVTPLRAILSKLSDDFDVKYEILNDEIGRGGFSIVYKCQNRLTKEIYAVKV